MGGRTRRTQARAGRSAMAARASTLLQHHHGPPGGGWPAFRSWQRRRYLHGRQADHVYYVDGEWPIGCTRRSLRQAWVGEMRRRRGRSALIWWPSWSAPVADRDDNTAYGRRQPGEGRGAVRECVRFTYRANRGRIEATRANGGCVIASGRRWSDAGVIGRYTEMCSLSARLTLYHGGSRRACGGRY